MASSLRAIIAGGGLGGLAAAAALARRNWSVTVFERQPELRASGSGIYIWENGLRVLSAIGADALVLKIRSGDWLSSSATGTAAS